jgi:hypothetical protein
VDRWLWDASRLKRRRKNKSEETGEDSLVEEEGCDLELAGGRGKDEPRNRNEVDMYAISANVRDGYARWKDMYEKSNFAYFAKEERQREALG